MLRVLKEIMIKIELVKNEDKMFQVIVKIVMIFKEYSQTTKAKEESKGNSNNQNKNKWRWILKNDARLFRWFPWSRINLHQFINKIMQAKSNNKY